MSKLPEYFHFRVLGGRTKIGIQDVSDHDFVEVVRCRDCKHWEINWTPQGVSDGRHYCAPLDLFPSADWYCSDGEKREES